MSDAGTIPYHLRQNKAIDRNLFIDLLTRVGRYRNISEFVYIGFGGPFLEDFKAVHSHLRLSNMISLEANSEIRKRQKFNQPVSCIDPRHTTSSEFLTEYDFAASSIVWFDYTSPADLGIQLAEIELLTRKLNAGDVLKVTLNAAPESLGRPKDDMDLKQFRLERAKDRMTVYGPAEISEDDVTNARYPNLLVRCVESAIKKGLQTKPRCIAEPLSTFVYKDGQQMCTVAAIVLDKVDVDKFYSETRLKHWLFWCSDWSDLRSISVPQFSAKERMHIESFLPDIKDPSVLIDKLGYFVGEDYDEAKGLMGNFVQYYRMYPWYSRVIL
jgi:hypothetical protein